MAVESDMTPSVITGHCLCGFVSYEYSGVIGPAGYCHCQDCRRRSGSAFGISVKLDTISLTIVHGHLKAYTKTADSGAELTRSFCPECGSALFTVAVKSPQITYVQAGSIDDSSVAVPVKQSWLCSAVPWCEIDPDLPAYEKGATR